MKTILTKLTIINIALLLSPQIINAQNENCHINDWTALKAIYHATDGDNWNTNYGWDTHIGSLDTIHPNCHLEYIYGVNLNEIGRVSYINLNTNLNGSLPKEIGDLPYLTYLRLSYNPLTGNIPPEIGNLTNLTELILSNNQFDGEIPVEIENLTNLTRLDLSNNQLIGSIPPEIESLTNLTELYLSDNQFTESIPPEIGDLINLTILNLSNNHLTGSIPDRIGDLSNLNSLALVNNLLDGNLPTTIGDLTELTNLNIHTNQFDGSIPAQIGDLQNIRIINLSNNQFNGNIPIEIGYLTTLTDLYLNDNELSGSIPIQIGNLINLDDLHAQNNLLSGSIPNEIGDLISANDINLSNNSLSGEIPGSIGNISGLFYLDLSNNELSGSLPSSIGNLGSINGLDLSNNELTGSIPSSFANLYTFSVANNQLTGCFPNSFAAKCDYYYYYYVQYDFSGNSLEATWDDFCAAGAGVCSNTGCTNSCATNYNSSATIDDGSCILPEEPTDLDCFEVVSFNNITCSWETNFFPPPPPMPLCFHTIDFDEATCSYIYSGEMPPPPPTACYQFAFFDGFSCVWIISGEQPDQPTGLSCNEIAVFDEATCDWEILNTCQCNGGAKVLGCTDIHACNYNANANCEDGSCYYAPCGGCVDNLTINSNTPFQNIYSSNNSISTQGTVNIQPNQKVNYRSNHITLNPGFSVKAGSNFNVSIGGCDLLFYPTEEEGSIDLDSDIVARAQNFAIDPAQLLGQSEIQAFLFDEEVTITFEQQGDDENIWKGNVNGDPFNDVLILKSGDIYIGNFIVDGVLHQIRYAGDGIYQIREIDQSMIPDGCCDFEPVVPSATVMRNTNNNQLCTTDSGNIIDVLVAYTTNSKNASGGEQPINAEIELAVEETNLTYENSGINQRLRLVGTLEVNYQIDDSDFSGDLDWAIDNGSIISERNRLGADCVVLVGEDSGQDTAGKAKFFVDPSNTSAPPSPSYVACFAERAFAVVERQYATSNYTFAHELGHLMGVQHNCEIRQQPYPFYDHSYGYSYCGGNDKWTTIMSYRVCDNAKIPYWSNPQLQYRGVPLGDNSGVCKSNSALTLNNTASIVANFRCSVVSDCELINCENGGTCIDGTCDCPDGYLGDNCEFLDIVGEWDATNFCQPADLSYTPTIEKLSGDSYLISSFLFIPFNSPHQITATYNVSEEIIEIVPIVYENITYTSTGLLSGERIWWRMNEKNNITGEFTECTDEFWDKM